MRRRRHERAADPRRALERAVCSRTRKAFSRAPASNSSSRAARATIAAPSQASTASKIAYLSAAEITTQLALGAVHLGITGEDLVREMIADADREVVFIDQLGFGFANVAVAVPQAWIDVRIHGRSRRRRHRVSPQA